RKRRRQPRRNERAGGPSGILPEQEVEGPATADVWARRAQVVEQVGSVAAALLQRVGQDGEADGVKGALFVPLQVGGLSEIEDSGATADKANTVTGNFGLERIHSRVAPEGVAQDVAQESGTHAVGLDAARVVVVSLAITQEPGGIDPLVRAH